MSGRVQRNNRKGKILARFICLPCELVKRNKFCPPEGSSGEGSERSLYSVPLFPSCFEQRFEVSGMQDIVSSGNSWNLPTI